MSSLGHARFGGCAAIAVVAAMACDSQPAAPPGGTSDATAPADPDGGGVGDADAADEPGPIVAGNVVWRRLNRTEYRNTVRDLLGTSLDPGADLPSDDLGYGFDNVASVLTMSPLHLELYERSARVLADEITTVPITEEQRLLIEAETLEIVGEYGGVSGGAFVLWSPGELTAQVDVPRAGAWRFVMRGWESAAGDERAMVALWVDGAVVEVVELTEAAAEQSIEVTLAAGRHALGVEFINDFYEPPADRNAFIDWFGLVGPVPLDVYEESAWARQVKCRPEVFAQGADAGAARACAEATVRALADGAWRRPSADEDVASLMGLYDAAVGAGAGGIEALRGPLMAVLMSPRFLFKAEMPRADGWLDGYEVATRLSYFLWSTMPDAALMEAARDGRLGSAEGIAAEVRRMLADARAQALVDNFAGQWLYIRDVDNAIPDPWAFPEFDDALRHAMSEEMRRFFASFVWEDRSLLELVTAHETWVNRRLAEHYGLEGEAVPTSDEAWARVSVAEVGRRGILSQAGLLTALSTPFRTSIVRRGKWVLGQLLCDEPSPPPPGVEGLIDMAEPGAPARTLREKMELHKTEEQCRVCHQTMDAIGFALEGFDGIGMTRTTDNGHPIDARGVIRGVEFEGPLELSEVIGAEARLPGCMVDKVMVYALGRGLGAEDEPLLGRIGEAFAARGYRFAALVELVATSEAFRRREGEP